MTKRVLLGLTALALAIAGGFGFPLSSAQDAPSPVADSGTVARLATSRDAFKTIDQMREAGQHIDPTKHHDWSRRLMEAEREVAASNADRVAATRAHVDRMSRLMKDIKLQWEHAEVSRLEYLETQFHHDEAVSWWEVEKSKR